MTTKKRSRAARPSVSAVAAPAAGPTACPFDPVTAARLAARPVDPRRRLPMPAMNTRPGPGGRPEADFLSIDPDQVLGMAMRRECAVCGQTVWPQYAFLSGPLGAANLASANPPAHEGCLLAALTLCPWIARPGMRRATGARAARLDDDPRQELAKPAVWVLGVTDSYHVETGGPQRVLIRPARWLRQRRFRYADGRLSETFL